MKAYQQDRLFQTEDLPLFSETCPTTPEPELSVAPAMIQDTLPAQCAACLDTGRLDDGFCWCEAGENAHAAVLEMNGMGPATYYDVTIGDGW